MAHHAHEPQVTVLPPDKAKIKKLWTVALYLLVITVIEFIIAFTVPHEYKQLRVWVFVGLTIVKAAYIVGEFMHLRYEVKVLFWSILIPYHLHCVDVGGICLRRELKCRYFNNDL
jgi:cytochrome c oxidase subunit 4